VAFWCCVCITVVTCAQYMCKAHAQYVKALAHRMCTVTVHAQCMRMIETHAKYVCKVRAHAQCSALLPQKGPVICTAKHQICSHSACTVKLSIVFSLCMHSKAHQHKAFAAAGVYSNVAKLAHAFLSTVLEHTLWTHCVLETNVLSTECLTALL